MFELEQLVADCRAALKEATSHKRIPFVLFMAPVFTVFRGLSEQKATGIGALVGGFTEAFVIFGVLAMFVSQVAAIILLVRIFSRAHPGRAVFSVLSMCCSGLALTTMDCVYGFSSHIYDACSTSFVKC